MAEIDRLDDVTLEAELNGLYDYENVEVPKLPVEERLSGFPEIIEGYSEAEALLEARRCLQCQDPPCVKTCPAHLDIPGYIQKIVEGDLKQGLQIIMDTYPLPGTCGRICFHPCVDVCLKGVKGQSIEIPRLRRYITDRVDQRELDYRIPEPNGLQVALIGSGPASLAAAYHLTRWGYKTVVYEKDEKPGGTLNILPEYRLPHRVLREEIAILEWLGVEIRTGEPIGGDGCIDRLLEAYDAVFIAVGAVGSWKFNIPGADLAGSITGLDYLHAVEQNEPAPGDRVAIIGGGDVAMDTLRTALRQGKEIHFVYRRTPEQMPSTAAEVVELGEEVTQEELHHTGQVFAQQKRTELLERLTERMERLTDERRRTVAKEVAWALKSEVFSRLGQDRGWLTIHFLTQPIKILGDERERVTGMECLGMELGEPDESGRRKPIPIEGSEFIIPADTVVFAIGQNVESGWLGADSGVETKKWGEIIVDEETGETFRPGVYAGGDAVRGPSSMIEVIADGNRAARAIDRALRAGREESR
ncbi:MAG: FAD-dependent oxidoreductase [Candidatus Bipolaricaulia bacterium]